MIILKNKKLKARRVFQKLFYDFWDTFFNWEVWQKVVNLLLKKYIFCFAGNRYLHEKKADCFVKTDSFVEEGKSKIHVSEDGLFTYRLDLHKDFQIIPALLQFSLV